MIKVDHITFSQIGGAGIAANSLVKEQNNHLIDAQLITLTDKKMKNLIFKHPILFLYSILDYFIVRSKKSYSLFSLYRAKYESKINIRNESIIHIHWMPGILSLKQLLHDYSNRKIVLHLHDYWFLTGGCHFNNGCDNFKSKCKQCPQVRKMFFNQVELQQIFKLNLFKSIEKLAVISPLENLIKELHNLDYFSKDTKLYYVPNVNPIFDKKSKRIRNNKIVISCISDNFDEKRKNIDAFYEYVEILSKLNRDNNQKIEFKVIGSISFKNRRNNNNIEYLGYLNRESLFKYYDEIDLNFSFSFQEFQPNVIYECSSYGIPSILSSIEGHLFAEKNGLGKLFESPKEAAIFTFKNLISDISKLEQFQNSAFKFNNKNEIIKTYFEIYENL